MCKQNCRHALKQKIRTLLLALALALPLLLGPPPPPAEAAVADIIPFLNVIVGWGQRNRVYRTANAYIADKNEYYDRLRDTARRQLQERELGGLTESQVAAYIKVVGLVEGERQAMADFAESEKRAARADFIDEIRKTLERQMLASTPATRVLSAFGNGVRSSRSFIDQALEKLAGGGGGVLAEVQRARRIASRISLVGQLIGGRTGEQIRAAGERIVVTIDRPTGEIEEGLVQVQEDLGALGDLVSAMQAEGYVPTVSEVGQDVLVSLLTGEEGNPAAQAIVDMLVAQEGGGGGFRERARDVLDGRTAVRCVARAERIRQVLFRLELDLAGEEAGAEAVDLPACEAVDLTELTEAAGAAPTAPAATPAASATPLPATATARPTTTAQPATPTATISRQDLEPCALIPAGGEIFTNGEWTCMAQYGGEPNQRKVQLQILEYAVDPERLCDGLGAPNDYRTFMEEVEIGDCGVQETVGYQGAPAPGYTGWVVTYYYRSVLVNVSTAEAHPAQEDWIYETARAIEQAITEMIP